MPPSRVTRAAQASQSKATSRDRSTPRVNLPSDRPPTIGDSCMEECLIAKILSFVYYVGNLSAVQFSSVHHADFTLLFPPERA